ncbi:hypothetical protein GLOIN_2v1528288 [Rhizophagus irregularis DAOM 181602=DAOM 197198]|nr:hypothetical protein GLOIN_2v1528288 [Rhizophagus irregularis DAOM 181602=DAOM 197198]
MESQQNDDSSILMSADPKIKQEFPGSCSSTSGPSSKPHLEEDIESKYYDAGKRHKILYSWKDAIGNIDIRETLRKRIGFSKTTISPTIFEIFNKKQLNKSRKIRIYVLKKIFIKFSIWSTICRRQTSPVLSLVITTVISEYSSLLNCFASLDEIEDRWCANFAKVTELNNEDRANFCKCQIILRNFTLHDLINEMFRDPLLELVWANSESTASKRQRSNDKENTVKDFIKLGDFQVATLKRNNQETRKQEWLDFLRHMGYWCAHSFLRNGFEL